MNSSESAHSTKTTHLRARNIKHWFTLRRLILVICLFVILIALLAFYLTSPTNQLVRARALWASNGYASYRIVVKYEIPLYQCEQDFEVRDEIITYRHKDECRVSPVAGSSAGLLEPMTVSALFRRIETNLNNPPCGQNWCLCDGPV